MSIGNSAPRPKFTTGVFAMRGTRTKWPTLRGAQLNDAAVQKLRQISGGVVFLDGEYETRLNMQHKAPQERAVFFEYKYRLRATQHQKAMSAYLLVWVGSYYNGCVVHIAPQYPQCLYFNPHHIELVCFQCYRRIVSRVYTNAQEVDAEVAAFCRQRAPAY